MTKVKRRPCWVNSNVGAGALLGQKTVELIPVPAMSISPGRCQEFTGCVYPATWFTKPRSSSMLSMACCSPFLIFFA